ncbi:MAG TPA: hypothetical protein VK803_00865 [Steroidobacteraceae bacterium]|jgi:hypothetical protein|nr:hypothetical protein [Steroidobacteraceae bacterium]
MRVNRVVLACLGVAGFTFALADPPPAAQRVEPTASAPAPAASPAPAATPAPATQASSASPAAAAAAPEVDPREKRLLSMGYKPQMVHGEKRFCKRETVMGSRTDMVSRCGTVDQLTAETQLSREATDNAQRTQLPAAGH